MRIKDEVRVIAAYENGNVPASALSCCLPHEIAKWLKNAPLIAEWGLGYDLLPAFAALRFDGVSKSLLNSESPRLKVRVNALLPKLEVTRMKLNT
jgi:hypothetical protein